MLNLSQQYGKVEVSTELISRNPDEFLQLMAGLVIVRAEAMLHKNKIEYIAWSRHFRTLVPGEITPEYVAECSRHEDGSIEVKWIEQDVQQERKLKTIVVNGIEVKTDMFMATYTDILMLTDLPLRDDYTMTWSDKKDKGTMRRGGKPVLIKDGMIFNAVLTGDA